MSPRWPPGADLSTALGRFERNRRPLVDMLQRRGHDEGASALGGWPGSESIVNLAVRLMRFAPPARQRADILQMSGLDGTGFDLAAAGVRAPVPW